MKKYYPLLFILISITSACILLGIKLDELKPWILESNIHSLIMIIGSCIYGRIVIAIVVGLGKLFFPWEFTKR